MKIRVPQAKLIRVNTSFRMNADFFARLAVVLYFSCDFIQLVCNFFLHNTSYTRAVSVLLIYTPVLLACFMRPKKYVKPDFLVLLSLVCLFFLVTYAVHPEYRYYYTRDVYGVWRHVLIPYRGIYAYLFVRMIDDPKILWRCLRIAGWIMLLYFAYQIARASSRGYWTGVVGLEDNAKMGYSVEFGYKVLPFALLFLYSGLKGNRLDLAVAVVDIAMMLVGGSRGSFLFLGLFFVLYILVELKDTKHKVVKISAVAVVAAVLYLSYQSVLVALESFLADQGITSRFLSSLTSGTMLDDNGRNYIWSKAVKLIRNNPYGYGAMGSRMYISKIIVAGYPHSIILEMLIDFGVFAGSALLLGMAYASTKNLFSNQYGGWSSLYLAYFCAACSLFISMTFWSVSTFWICLALCVNCYLAKRRKGKLCNVQGTREKKCA